MMLQHVAADDNGDCLVAACGPLCIYRKRISSSTVLADQRLGAKEVDEGIWFVTVMRCALACRLAPKKRRCD